MASAKIILFDAASKQLKDGTFPITLRVTHMGKRNYFSLNRSCTPKFWNKESSRFRSGFPRYKKENDVLQSIESRANQILRDFERFDISFSFSAFEAKFLEKKHSLDLVGYFDQWINKFEAEGKMGTASPYKTTKNALIEFADATKGFNSKDLRLNDVNYKFLIDFEHWLRTKRDCMDSSISVYMRTLRSVFNKAIKEKLVHRDHYPFEEYLISERLSTETQKRAIDKATVKQIEALTFDDHTPAQLAQHIFLFSYYTRGMNFVDIAFLTPRNIHNGRINYTRRKTKKTFTIKIHPKAQEIIDFHLRHKVKKGNYIFPIFDESIHITDIQKYHRRKTALRQINKHLKEIAGAVGMENLKLTSYVSRHTYATVLKKAGKNTALISEALGHQSEKVTQIYLKSFENSELDDADADVL